MGKHPNPLDYHDFIIFPIKIVIWAHFHTYPDEQMGQSPQTVSSYSTHQAGGFAESASLFQNLRSEPPNRDFPIMAFTKHRVPQKSQ